MAAPAPGRPVVNLAGRRVMIGPAARDHLPVFTRWHGDFATSRTLGQPGPFSLEQHVAGYEALPADERLAFFTVLERSSGHPIGLTYLADIDQCHGTAEFGLLIGEADRRGQGYGTEATRLMLDYAFLTLGLRSVMLTVYEYNLAGRRAYEKAGFRQVGRRRQSALMAGRLWDVIYMECLAPEWAR